MKYDLILRHATIIDGGNTPRYRGDIAIDGDRIAAVGDLRGAVGREELHLDGKVAAPGFIDAHTHDDGALLRGGDMSPKTSQGVTTVVAGNCGLSLAPLRFNATPPPPFTLLGGCENFRFDSFADYCDELQRHGTTVNAALLVGHTTLRQRVMPKLNRAANDAEIAAMHIDVEAAMHAGAFGLSTGLDYEPAVASSTAEIKSLAAVAARHGGHYVTHTRNYFEHMETALEEAFEIAQFAETQLIISHHQCTGKSNFGKAKSTLQRIDAVNQSIDVAFDVYPYAASSTVLRLERCDQGLRILITWSAPHPQMANRELHAIAAQWGVSECEAAQRLLPAGAVYFQLDEADVSCLLQHPRCMIGSDGLPHDHHPHPRLWGSFARVLGHYCRDEGLFGLEEAVHRMTGLTARVFGIKSRGRLLPGYFADLTIFDPNEISDQASFQHPKQAALGIELVMVNGVAVWRREDGACAARPGRVLRPL